MAITNSLKRQIDLPVFEWTRFAPAVSSAISCTCAADNSNYNAQFGRYVYYLIAAAGFWRYDTWTDSYVQLSSPVTTPTTWSSMRFVGSLGFEGRVLGSSSTSITIPAYFGRTLKGYDVMIVSGTGAGQRRTIIDVADPIAADTGVPTAVNNVQGALTITDTLKSWTTNQWAGYQVRITFGTGVSQVRRILYNSATVLTLGDSAKHAEDMWCNPAITSPAIVATAGSQSIYTIESSVVTINNAWGVTPDTTSRFRFFSGGIALFSSAAATPFYTAQWYDIVSDTWYIRSAATNNVAVVGTDGTIEVTPETVTYWDRGTATTGTSGSITDTTKSWTTNQWTNYAAYVLNGTGEGQIRKVTSNTTNTLNWAVSGSTADTTTNYALIGFTASQATSANYNQLQDTNAAWTSNQWTNYAVRIMYGTGAGQLIPILNNTANLITTVKPWTIVPDTTSVYAIQGDSDKIYLMLGANAATLIHNIEDDQASYGRLNDSGTARQGSAQYANYKAVAINTITFSTTTATVTTINNHNYQTGYSIVILGATGADAPTYNKPAGTSITVTGANTFTYTMSATPAGNATFTAQSTTVLVDATKNWITNQWANYMCYMGLTTGATPTGQALMITSNTANTLTFTIIGTAPSNGLTRYIITPRSIVGTPSSNEHGIATGAGQLTTALQDTTKTWVVNIYAGRKVKLTGGAGQSQESTITSNTANTLTYGAGTLPVAASTSYAIIQPPVRGTGIELNWAWGTSNTNIRGKYLFIPRAGGVLGFDRLDITTDLWQLMATTPQSETLTTGSMYAYDGQDRWYFTKDITQRLYYLDMVQNTIEAAGIYPYTAGTAIIGNRMEIFTTIDGLKYLWLNRHSNSECFRTLLFY